MTTKKKITNSFIKLPFINTYREAELCADVFFDETKRILVKKEAEILDKIEETEDNEKRIMIHKVNLIRDLINEINHSK
jgi:hypothetical protein